MPDELIEAWRTNDRITRLLLGSVSDDGLGDTLSKRGGRDVAAQFAHIHTNRVWQIEKRGRGLAEGLSTFTAKDHPARATLDAALVKSGEAVARFLAAIAEGKARGLKKGLPTYLAYLVAHEAHHRGNILLTLKTSGHPVDKDVRYAIWDWDRR